MSDEQRKEEETEVEAHMRRYGNDEPSAEGDAEGEDDFEAHRFKTNRVKND